MMKNLESILISPDTSIRDAVSIIDKSGLRIAIVVDKNNQIQGIVSDGDIRRSVMGNIPLDSKVKKIMNESPIYANKDEPISSIRSKMKMHNLVAVPILDNKKVIDIETVNKNDRQHIHENVIFIMAGGFGKRLQPLTLNCPKPMLKLNDKPILETIINNFKSYGFKNFIISTHFMPEIIKDYFKDGSFMDVNIEYVYEENPLGTGGALGLLSQDISNKPMIVINGDILTSMDFNKLIDYHNSNNSLATVVVRDYELKIPYGVVESKNLKITDIVEKPSYKYFVNAGIYVLNPEIYLSVNKDEKIDMPDLLKRHLDKNKNSIYPIHEYWSDIGSKEDFEKAKSEIQFIQND